MLVAPSSDEDALDLIQADGVALPVIELSCARRPVFLICGGFLLYNCFAARAEASCAEFAPRSHAQQATRRNKPIYTARVGIRPTSFGAATLSV
jgi:hypothetical protein